MTFTEAAIEILRRAGKPLHFKEIAAEAVRSGLLSHVGQTPEATMGARLMAMARREHERRVVATEAGLFGLPEWGVPHETQALEATQVEEVRDEGARALRPKERHPPLQNEHVLGARRDDRRRRDDDEGRRKKRYQPPADVAWQWLRERGQPATLQELAQGLRSSDKIAEALEREPESLEKALQEENRRRADSHRPPLFQFEPDGRVIALELPKEAPRERPERPAKPARREEVRPPAGAEEQRRNVIRLIRRRVNGLDAGGFERVVVSFLESTGYRELNMARRSKEGAFYLARRKWGSGELRYALRVLKPGREMNRQDVQDLRRDLTRYSAQIGVLFATGECSREAKSECNAPGQAPVMLYGGEAFAESLIDAGLGATRRMVEWVEYDEEFFNSVGGELPPVAENLEVIETPAPEADGAVEEGDDHRRGRDRRRDRQGRNDQEGAAEADGTTPAEDFGRATEDATEPPTPGTSDTAAAPAQAEEATEPVPVSSEALTEAPAPDAGIAAPVADQHAATNRPEAADEAAPSNPSDSSSAS